MFKNAAHQGCAMGLYARESDKDWVHRSLRNEKGPNVLIYQVGKTSDGTLTIYRRPRGQSTMRAAEKSYQASKKKLGKNGVRYIELRRDDKVLEKAGDPKAAELWAQRAKTQGM